ncbi:PIG-L deacetylase family protein [Halobacteriovorax sp. RT-2-6]|uniref:PIG-L deacetylase family protein n=1 Tax=unclassified Halobacteriovorax TaxID=2639665 RepID=UPI00399BA448
MNVLVVVAHSDDEILGCGGSIAKHIRNGDTVHLLVMTDGVGARSNSNIDDINSRSSSLYKSCENLGIRDFHQENFPDNEMDTISLLSIVRTIESYAKAIKPEIIYTHSNKDLNIDHQITHRAVLTAFRPQPDSSVRTIYGFEVLSSTEWSTIPFEPTAFNILSEQDISILMKSLEIYSDEIRESPHSRSSENFERILKVRGSTIGVDYAEAFEVYRDIIK